MVNPIYSCTKVFWKIVRTVGPRPIIVGLTWLSPTFYTFLDKQVGLANSYIYFEQKIGLKHGVGYVKIMH